MHCQLHSIEQNTGSELGYYALAILFSFGRRKISKMTKSERLPIGSIESVQMVAIDVFASLASQNR